MIASTKMHFCGVGGAGSERGWSLLRAFVRPPSEKLDEGHLPISLGGALQLPGGVCILFQGLIFWNEFPVLSKCITVVAHLLRIRNLARAVGDQDPEGEPERAGCLHLC